jgi:hypothetical protein
MIIAAVLAIAAQDVLDPIDPWGAAPEKSWAEYTVGDDGKDATIRKTLSKLTKERVVIETADSRRPKSSLWPAERGRLGALVLAVRAAAEVEEEKKLRTEDVKVGEKTLSCEVWCLRVGTKDGVVANGIDATVTLWESAEVPGRIVRAEGKADLYEPAGLTSYAFKGSLTALDDTPDVKLKDLACAVLEVESEWTGATKGKSTQKTWLSSKVPGLVVKRVATREGGKPVETRLEKMSSKK